MTPVSPRYGHRGFIVGGGWTHSGRFLVRWDSLDAAYSCSLSDIRSCSVESGYWLEGFLNGQRPTPWFSDDFDLSSSDPRTDIYWSAIRMFRRTGVWRETPGFDCVRCGSPFHPTGLDVPRALPSNPGGELCFSCQPIALESLWPRVDKAANGS